jgi:hypothetical protein
MISVNATPQAVKNALVKWAFFYKGKVLADTNDFNKVITLHPDSLKKFQMAHDIAAKVWNSYEKDIVRKWQKGEWERFKQLSETQVEETPSARKGYKLFIKTREREGEIEVLKQAGYKATYTPGFFRSDSKGNPTIYEPGMPIYSRNYVTAEKTLPFYSIVRFFIFEDKGKTFIYAYAFPVEGASQTQARYGSSIGHSWYKYIDACVEAEMVKDALNYLRNLERADKLQEFENK